MKYSLHRKNFRLTKYSLNGNLVHYKAIHLNDDLVKLFYMEPVPFHHAIRKYGESI